MKNLSRNTPFRAVRERNEIGERGTHRLKGEREEEAGEEEETTNRTERKGVQDDDVEEEDEEEELELGEGEGGGDEFEDGLWLRPRGFIYNL